METIGENQEMLRFTKEFVGISHQLEQRRKERRRIEVEERAIANRVIFLEKEEIRAQKQYSKKKDELSRIVNIAQRQAYQDELKEKLYFQREKQLQQIRQQNRLRRMLNRQAKDFSHHHVLGRKSLDYKMSKQALKEGQKRKRQEKLEQLTSRKEHYMTLNIKKEQGRSRINQFYHDKNKEHTQLYKEKIMKEQGKAMQKTTTIKKLEQIQNVLRKKLEQSTMRVSQMQQIIGDFGKSFKNKSLSRISKVSSKSRSRSSLSISPETQSPVLITSIEGELMSKKQEGVEQKIEQGEGGISEGGKVRARRKNKHANRYREYELF